VAASSRLVTATACTVAALIAAASAQHATSSRDYRYIMGTSVEVEASGGDPAVRKLAIDEAFGAIVEVDRLMSTYRDDSELAHLNHMAGRGPVTVSDPILDVVGAAQRVSTLSHGAFDVTVGPLVALWGFHDKRPHLPSPAELDAVRPLVSYQSLVVSPADHTVCLTRSGMAIDLGGIAKGFAVEVAANVLRRHGLSGFIDAGGNQYLLGTPPDKRVWTIGVKDPDSRDQLLGVIDTGETSVSTSAGYSNFLTMNGRTYGHILDPHTLAPSTASLSATVLSKDGTLADAVSTAAFVLGPDAGLALIDSFDGMSGLIAYRASDGQVRLAMSPKLKSAFHSSRRPAQPPS
jgi:thiamine biosynthesis lipoprotein ApbE